MIDLHRNSLEDRVMQRALGERFTLRELLGDEWPTDASEGERRHFGKTFREAVTNGEFQGVAYVGIRRNGRANEYERV